LPKLPVGTAKDDLAVGRAQRQGGGDVVDDLRHDARPVDRIHRRQPHLVAEGQVVEQAFTRSWQSSKLPSIAMLWTLGDSTVVICRRCTSDWRP
jgi:hypothetical protein